MIKSKYLKKIPAAEIVFFDVGAKGGTKELQKLAPLTTIFAFEPHPAEAELLKQKTTLHRNFSKYSIYDLALSDKTGIADLNLMKNSSMSSLLEPDFENYQLHFGMMNGFADWNNNIGVNGIVEVEVNMLDSFANENSVSQIDFLKLDTQGTELKILNGAKYLFENHLISVIKTEVAFVPVYKEQCLFSDVDTFLRKHDLQFVDCLFYENKIDKKPKMKNHSLLKENSRFSSGGDAVYVINIEKVSPEKKNETALKAGMILAELNYKSIAFDFLHHHALLDETTTVQLIQTLSEKNLRNRLKRTIKNWCPPKILYYLKNLF